MALTNLLTNPSFETDLAGWLSATAVTKTRAVDWSWSGGASMRCQGVRGASGALAYVILPGVGVPGKTIGVRLTANVLSNPGGLRLMAQTVNPAGTVGSPYVALTPAPRDPGVFNGTGEWEWRGLYTPPADAQANIYLFFTAVNGGTADVYIDAALASFDLIDRSVSRPGEGLDVPPYGDGDDPEWEWEGGVVQAHKARSVRKVNKVNWTRNPSGEVDASLAATSAGPNALTYDPATRIVPTRITSDLEAPNGAAVLEWQLIADPTGQAMVFLGDPANLAGTAAPVSNQEITVQTGSLRIMTALPAGAQAGPIVATFSKTGQRQTLKGYTGAPQVIGWASLGTAAMEEFPADTGMASVPNVPPRWALGGFLLTGLTPGGTYVVRTDKGMVRRDHLGTATGAPGYYDYFDGATLNAVWLGAPGVSASAVALAPDVPGAPSIPAGLTATYKPSPVGITVAWQASPEADTAGYRVRRGGVVIADTAATSYVDSTVAPATTYGYTVSAYDNGGAESPASAVVSVTTPPAPPGGLTATVTGQQVTLAWGAVTGATGYRAYRSGVQVYSGTAAGYVDSPSTGSYSYTVTATGGGGESAPSTQVAATVVTAAIVIAASATVPGLNATHTWYPPDGGPPVVLNRLGGVLPRVRLTGEIAGWGNPPPGEDRRTTPVGRVLAERPLRSGRHGKTLTYQGVVEARSDIDLRNTTGALSRALGDPRMGEGRMVVEPWDGRPAVEYTARVTGIELPEAYPSIAALGRRSRGFERSFTLQFHLARGRMFSTVQRQVDAAAGQITMTVDVAGNAPTEPVISLKNDVAADDVVQLVTPRRELTFAPLPSNNGLQVDFAARTIRDSAGRPPDLRGYLIRGATSSWWRGDVGFLPVGALQITRRAGRGAWSVQWRDAWW